MIKEVPVEVVKVIEKEVFRDAPPREIIKYVDREVKVEVPVEVIKYVDREVIKEVPGPETVREVPIEVIREVPVPTVEYVEVPRYVNVATGEVLPDFKPPPGGLSASMPPPIMMMHGPPPPLMGHGCCNCGSKDNAKPIKEVETKIEVVEKEVIKEVKVDIIKEVPKEVIKYVEVEVPVEVIREVVKTVEVPVEVIVEKKVEKEVEKRVEVPVQIIREVPVEVVKDCSCCQGQGQTGTPGMGMGPQQMGGMMPPPWACQYVEMPLPQPELGSYAGRVVEPVRVIDQHPPAERELVREVPYEVVREITKEVPIEIVRDHYGGSHSGSDVPYWQRQDFERQLDERKERRRTQPAGPRGADYRRDPAARTSAPMGPGGMRTAPGHKVWPDGAAGKGGGMLRGKPWTEGGKQTGHGYLTRPGSR